MDGLSSKHCIHRPIQEQNNLIELDLFIKLIQNKDLSLACFSINTVNKFLVELKLINLLNESIFSYKLQYFFLFLLIVIMGIRGFESQTFPFEPSRNTS